MVPKTVTITSSEGLHLRPATNLCKVAVSYDCDVTFVIGNYHASAKSVISVLAAKVKQGDEITLTCDGKDEQEAMEAIMALIERDLDLPAKQ